MGHRYVGIPTWAGQHQIVRGVNIYSRTITVYDQSQTVLVGADTLPIDLTSAHVGRHGSGAEQTEKKGYE